MPHTLHGSLLPYIHTIICAENVFLINRFPFCIICNGPPFFVGQFFKKTHIPLVDRPYCITPTSCSNSKFISLHVVLYITSAKNHKNYFWAFRIERYPRHLLGFRIKRHIPPLVGRPY